MNSRHLALIVEDDEATADDLEQIVASLDCDARRTDNRAVALRLLMEQTFCLVLLDLEIKQKPESIKGHIAQGNALFREIRTRYPGRHSSSFWTPVIVISGHANDVDPAVGLMRDGADDVIRKPLRLDDTGARIHAALTLAGRQTHGLCALASSDVRGRADRVLRIHGDLKGQRAKVTVSGKVAWLPTNSIRILLQLAIARLDETMVHKLELGAKPNEGFRAISRLRDYLRPAVGEEADIVANDQRGGYSLKPDVVVAECDAAKLKGLRDNEIDRLAGILSAMFGRREGKR